MTDHEIVRDDHFKYVTRHDEVPSLSTVEGSEAYSDLQSNSDEPLEWIRETYNREQLQELQESLEEIQDLQFDEWMIGLKAAPAGLEELKAELSVSAKTQYEFEIPGYGTANTGMDISLTYYEEDESERLQIGLEGEMQYDFPDHFSEKDSRMMQKDIERDIEHAMEEVVGTVEEVLD